MPKRASIDFVACANPNGDGIRFGGEPFGLPKLLWPVSKSLGEPMQFICQIPFGPDLFPGATESVAFLFMSSGDGAVIILPRGKLANSVTVGDAPRLYRMVKKWLRKDLVPESCVYDCGLTFSEDPAFISQSQLSKLPDSEAKRYRDSLGGNKLGGTPGFLQNDELPFPEPWHLLLQLDSTRVPFWINFGDAGIGYAFINGNGTEARFLWQCC
jgi:uncharacterized protein YwqG